MGIVIDGARQAEKLALRAARVRRPRTRSLVPLLEHDLLRDSREITQHIREGRFQRSLAFVAALSGVLGGLEVTTEHYRGSYSQRIMYSPVILSPLLAVAGIWGAFNRRAARILLPITSLLLLGDGLLGFFFHIRGIARKPGGWRIPIVNIIMGPPIFAPLLLGIGGFLGIIASGLRREDAPPYEKIVGVASLRRPAWLGLFPQRLTHESIVLEQDLREGRFQRILAGSMALSALLNGLEALYSHYKNRFRYPSQWLPIALTPALIVAGIGAIWSKRMARTWLPITSIMALLTGTIGFCYHARGALRHTSGGVSKPLHTLMYGPPLFAPLLFAATGFIGLLASLLRRAD